MFSWRLDSTETLMGHWPLRNNAKDLSGRNNHGTWSGTARYTTGLFNGNSVGKFGGINDYITLPAGTASFMNGQSDFTISVLFMATGGPCSIFDTRDGNDDGVVLRTSASNRVYVMLNTVDFYSDVLPFNKYFNLAFVKVGGGKHSLYLNGKFIGDADSSAQTVDVSIQPRIGIRAYDTSEDFQGNLGSIRIYNVGLTGDELVSLTKLDRRF